MAARGGHAYGPTLFERHVDGPGKGERHRTSADEVIE